MYIEASMLSFLLRGSVPATYYIDQLMSYLKKPYYVCSVMPSLSMTRNPFCNQA